LDSAEFAVGETFVEAVVVVVYVVGGLIGVVVAFVLVLAIAVFSDESMSLLFDV
jgi:hypothetical protein